MKKLKYKILIPASLFLIVAIVACSKSFLDKPPLGTLNPAIIASEAGVQGLLIGAYSLVDGEGASGDGFGSVASNWTYANVATDDSYKGYYPTDADVVVPFEYLIILITTNGTVT